MPNADSKNSALRIPNAALAKMEQAVLAELKRHFRPEFLNRVDDVIIFQSLDESELARIVDIQLGRLEQRLAQQKLTLGVDAAAKSLLAKEGYDPQFGAPAQTRDPRTPARPARDEIAGRRL